MGLEIKDLKKTYGEVTALDGISFTVRDGESFGLLGRNGAGKTTTIRILIKILERDSGDVRFNGKDIKCINTQFGYLPEERGLYINQPVKDQVVYLAKMYGLSANAADQRLKQLLERFGIPEHYNKKVKELSKGNKQKVQLIAAIIHDPEVVIFDEPFSGLDPVNIQLFKEVILDLKRKKKTIIFSSHRMEDIEEICDNIILLKKGKEVLSGTVPQIKEQFRQNIISVATDKDIKSLITSNELEIISHQDTKYDILYQDERSVQRLLQNILAKNINLTHLEFKYPTLHEIFLSQLGD